MELRIETADGCRFTDGVDIPAQTDKLEGATTPQSVAPQYHISVNADVIVLEFPGRARRIESYKARSESDSCLGRHYQVRHTHAFWLPGIWKPLYVAAQKDHKD